MLSTEGLSNENFVSEVLYSNLLRSNCPITNQPDWGTITVEYQGIQIDKYWLLQHIISYRNHNDFHENCVETIYSDLMDRYNFKKLTVFAQYTRRGGMDINPYRTNNPAFVLRRIPRLIRQ